MIDSSIIEYLDLGDSLQNLDIYDRKYLKKFFSHLRLLLKFKSFPFFIIIILNIIHFWQIFLLSVTPFIENDDHDTSIKALKCLKNYLFLENFLDTKKSYFTVVLIQTLITIIVLLSQIKINKEINKTQSKLTNFFCYIFNLLNILIIYYLITTFANLFLMSFDCDNDDIHKYLNSKCFGSFMHTFCFSASLFNILIWIILTVAYSFYLNELQEIYKSNDLFRINSKYELFLISFKISIFFVSYLLNKYIKKKKISSLIIDLYVLGICIFLTFYVYKYVLYYNISIYYINLYGWIFASWFVFIIVLKILFDIYDTIIFHILGFIILSILFYFLGKNRMENILTDFNIFESTSLKEIELFNIGLFNLLNSNKLKSRALMNGIIQSFEEYKNGKEDIQEIYNQLKNNVQIKKKFNLKCSLEVITIMYIVYQYHSEKSLFKNDVLINMCYFLINNCKNATYAIYLCSKNKFTKHIQLFHKYLLMEEIKEYLINKLLKTKKKESIKKIEITKVILFNIYAELLQIKIYDEVTNQIDYFHIIRNNITAPNSTANLLKTGIDILSIRDNIFSLRNKIIELNPFCDELQIEYLSYIQNILQDDSFCNLEIKNFEEIKNNQLMLQNSIYYSLFKKEQSSIILIEGSILNYKIIYTTENFSALFGFNGREILNMNLDDILPSVIATFHQHLVKNVLQYSNLDYSFKSPKDAILSGKNDGGIFNIKLFVKCMPNLSYGLIYICQITKILDNNYMILLDENLNIRAIPNIISLGMNLTIKCNFGLTNAMYGHHIATIIPEIFTQIKYKKNKFVLDNVDNDIKSKLYPCKPSKDGDFKVTNILEGVKTKGYFEFEEDSKGQGLEQYNCLLEDLNQQNIKPINIIYRYEYRQFLGGKYSYYRFYIFEDTMFYYEQLKNASIKNEIQINSQGNNNKNLIESYSESINVSNNTNKNNREIKFHINEDLDENDKMIDNNNSNDNEKINEKKENNKNRRQSHEITNLMLISVYDNHEFNKIKTFILEQNEITLILIVKISFVILIFLSLLCVICNFFEIKSKFQFIFEYLTQNRFFSYMKICVCSLYSYVLNIKWIKDGYMQKKKCPVDGYISCSTYYLELIKNVVVDIRKEKKGIDSFNEAFREQILRLSNISVQVPPSYTKEILSIELESFLNLIVTNAIKFNGFLEDSLLDNEEMNSIIENLREHLIFYYNNPQYDKIKTSNMQSSTSIYNSSRVYLIVYIVGIVAIMLDITWICFRIYIIEISFLESLIKFKSTNFDSYLKKLEDIKKNIKEESGEDEDKGNMDLNMDNIDIANNADSKNDNINNNENNKNHNKKDKDNTPSNQNENNENEKNYRNKKKGNNLKNKLHNKIMQQNKEKLKIMSKYFFQINIFFIAKYLAIVVIATSYFIILFSLEKSKRNYFLDMYGNLGKVCDVCKKTFDLFIGFIGELDKYENVLSQKEKLKNNELDYFEYYTNKNEENLVTCTKNNISICPNYTMIVKNNSEIELPKYGNLLMPIFNADKRENGMILKNLFNSDTCKVMIDEYPNSGNITYEVCTSIWAGILLKGIIQGHTQMGVVINTIIDDINTLNQGNLALSDFLDPSYGFFYYEYYVTFYVYKTFMICTYRFDYVLKYIISTFTKHFKILLFAYIIGDVILFCLLIYFQYHYTQTLRDFLNFIVIIPLKYLKEDDNLFQEILNTINWFIK